MAVPVNPLAAAPASKGPPPEPITDQVRDVVTGGPQAWGPLLDTFAHGALNLAIGGAILVGTLWVARWASDLTRDGLKRLHGHSQPDEVLQHFISSLVRYTVVVIGLISVLQQIGVQTTSVLAVLGAASLAVGLALQGGLSNVAAGVMILLLRPYRIGDSVEIAGAKGQVVNLDLFTTRLHDLDNATTFIPNGKAFGDVIVNYSMMTARRMQLDFRIDYDDDADLALRLLLEIADADPRVLKDPPPWAKVTALGDSAVTVSLKACTVPATYGDTRVDLIKAVRDRFLEEGLTFPYPHQVSVEALPRETTTPRRKAGAARRSQETTRARRATG